MYFIHSGIYGATQLNSSTDNLNIEIEKFLPLNTISPIKDQLENIVAKLLKK
jgi:hypothetical protein